MSSAVLYLAIVAIWAGFLVPAWIRRPHAAKSSDQAEFAPECETDTELDIQATAEADLEGSVHVEVSRHIQVSRHEHAAGRGVAGRAAGDALPGYDGAGHGLWHDGGGHRATTDARQDAALGADRDAVLGTGQNADAGAGHEPGTTRSGAPREDDRPAPPSLSRQQMLRARRRMLVTLASLTAFAYGLTVLGKAGWWICVLPTGVLVLYVLLLREVALAEAELAERRHRQAIAARAARQRAAHQASVASQPERTAQIIDISSRVGDQLYDQYADATVRAVGD